MKEHKGLDDLEIYRLAMEIGEEVWKLVSEWAWLEKKHPGIQYTEAADSIAANISEDMVASISKKPGIFASLRGGRCRKPEHGPVSRLTGSL